MRIINAKPPVWDEAIKHFPKIEGEVIFFTYGDTIYNPSGVDVPADIIRHEETHAEQQSHDEAVAAVWWKRFFQDPEFRLDQEAEAYAAQYKFLCAIYKDRNKRFQMLNRISGMLASPMYGGIISRSQAMKLISELCTMGKRASD